MKPDTSFFGGGIYIALRKLLLLCHSRLLCNMEKICTLSIEYNTVVLRRNYWEYWNNVLTTGNLEWVSSLAEDIVHSATKPTPGNGLMSFLDAHGNHCIRMLLTFPPFVATRSRQPADWQKENTCWCWGSPPPSRGTALLWDDKDWLDPSPKMSFMDQWGTRTGLFLVLVQKHWLLIRVERQWERSSNTSCM